MVDAATTPTATPPGSSRMKSQLLPTRAYQQEMLDVALQRNIIIALDTGSGKTHIAILRIKHELEREATKLCWFVAPTVALCQQQHAVISSYLPISVGIVSGSHYPDQWKNQKLWKMVTDTHRVMVSTPQVLLDALRHGYLSLGGHIGLLVLDEAHHAVDKHPYNMIMQEFYFSLPPRTPDGEECRPKILGLSASPIYGSGDIDRAFRTIERNLDSMICTPLYHRDELTRFVHRPVFKHAPYTSPDEFNTPFSTNLAALRGVINSLDIEDDPYVVSLRTQLVQAAPARGVPPSRDYFRLDQKLSKVLSKQDSFTHKGLRDLERAATDILFSIGTWATDWFVYAVASHIKRHASSNPFNNAMVLTSNVMSTWKNTEKRYLVEILGKLVLSPVSYYEDDIVDGCLDKVNVLIRCLLDEKEYSEAGDEAYSGLVFVQRRDAVFALAHLLSHHPATKDQFRIGTLLGTSDSAHRHSMMDITRLLPHSSVKADNDNSNPSSDSQSSKRTSPQAAAAATLADFKIGEKNLIISTSVAEEGIDIQACGSVIRWDPPPNMASWVQSRGRARRKRSTFTLMYDVVEDRHQGNVEKWKALEERMREMMKDGLGVSGNLGEEGTREDGSEEPGDWDMELKNAETGATINPHSAVSHLSHFCAVISRVGGTDNRPLYDIDPPDYALGWHSSSFASQQQNPYQGPWASTVTLPRSLSIPRRIFTTQRVYATKLAAHRHAAFKAYVALHGWDLLNANLLPFTGNGIEGLEEEVKRILSEIGKREGLQKVALQVDPWAAFPEDEGNGVVAMESQGEQGGEFKDAAEGRPNGGGPAADGRPKRWYVAEMTIDTLPPLLFFTQRPMMRIEREDGPKLYRAKRPILRASIVPLLDNNIAPRSNTTVDEYSAHKTIPDDDPLIQKARVFSRMVFWCFYGTKMKWEKTDFAYLVLPVDQKKHKVWDEKRAWLEAGQLEGTLPGVRKEGTSDAAGEGAIRPELRFVIEASTFAKQWGYLEEAVVVKRHASGKGLKFLGWHWERLSEEDEEAVRESYGSKKDKRKSKPGDVKVMSDDNSKEVDAMVEVEKEDEKMVIPYPLLIVEPFPPRTNFLHPLPNKSTKPKKNAAKEEAEKVPYRSHLIPHLSGIALYSPQEVEYAFLLPSVLRWLGNHLTSESFQRHHFSPLPRPTSLLSIPRSLLTVALTAPVSGERYNYQRLETLGDAVLKFVVGVQLYAEFPMWHEGYLTRGKDHAVSNMRLAKEDCKREVFRWIIRDIMLGKKWSPKYIEGAVVEEIAEEAPIKTTAAALEPTRESPNAPAEKSGEAEKIDVVMKENTAEVTAPEEGAKSGDKSVNGRKGKKRGKSKGGAKGKSQQLSTKVLADVVESLIGSAYEHGGFDLGYECAKFFDLGVKWQPIPSRLDQILSTVRTNDNLEMEIPSQIGDVESMIGYTFKRKILLIEALTHSSYRENIMTASYERLEFLGDGILDMIVTDYLYHAPGEKEYSPGHMHIRKSAVVNGHFLSYICLGLSHAYDAIIPQPSPSSINEDGGGGAQRNPYSSRMDFVPGVDRQEIYLWQCLLHSNQGVLDDQTNTFTRYGHRKDDIKSALESGSVFPWAALTKLQAPKFFSDIVESIIGAVFVDSKGDMETIKGVLRGIGILPVLERIVRDDIDVLHPVSRLSVWASRNNKEIEYVFEQERGNVSCIIKVDGVEEVRETERYRGKSSQEEAKFAAAEKAIGQFKLRGAGHNDSDFGSKKKADGRKKS